MTTPDKPNDTDARGRIADALDGVLDQATLDLLMQEVLAITKQARGWCPGCKKAVQVDIPDAKAVVSAMGDLLTQGLGRPTEQQANEHITVNYTVLLENPDGSTEVVPPAGERISTSNGAAG